MTSMSKTISLDLDQVIFKNISSYNQSIEIEFLKPNKYYEYISFNLIEFQPVKDSSVNFYNKTIQLNINDSNEKVIFDDLESNRKFKLTATTLFKNKSKSTTQDVYSGMYFHFNIFFKGQNMILT
jgi:hypothetical protein